MNIKRFMLTNALTVTFILSCMVSICFAIKPVAGNSYNYDSVSLNTNQISIGGISPFDTPEKVESILGIPEQSEESYLKNGYRMDEIKIWRYTEKYLVVAFTNDKVSMIIADGKNTMKTPDDIGIGSTKADIFKAYGSIPFYTDKADDNIVKYLYRAAGEKTCLIRLTCVDDKVYSINLFHW